MLVISEAVKFQAHLQRGGIGLEEMKRLLLAYAECGDELEVKRRAFEDNLLGKTSKWVVKDMLYAFRRRLLSNSGLPPAELVGTLLKFSIPEAAKNQTLFPYFIVTDPLAERCYRDLVLSQVNNSNPQLTRKEVRQHLEALSLNHPELAKWSEKLKERWSSGFLTMLRRFNLMERSPKKNLKRLWLLLKPFAFFWLWFWEQGGSFWSAVEHPLWELLQVDERRIEELLVEGQLRGWWSYQRSGSIVDFQPRFPTLKEWLVNALGGSD
jgi:hypothetical protein